VSLHCQLELDILAFLSVLTGTNLEEWGQANVGAVTRNLISHIRMYIDMNIFSRCSVEGNSLPNLVRTFLVHPAYRKIKLAPRIRVLLMKLITRTSQAFIWPKQSF
jgi:hypothetical protein